MEEVIEKDFVPEATKQGKRLIRTYDVPELAKYDERYYNPDRDSNVNNQDWTGMEEQR